MKENLIQCLESGLREGVAPNVACSVIAKGKIIFEHRCATPVDALFDLASLTKVMFITSLCALEMQGGRLDLGKPIAEIVDTKYLSDCTLRDLLAHQSGLPAWQDYQQTKAENLLAKLLETPLQSPIRSTVRYSDTGFLLLGKLLELELQAPLDQLYTRLPAEMRAGIYPWYVAAEKFPKLMLPTGRSAHRQNICGAVHDDNAFYLGDMQPHAGLFGDLGSVTAFVSLWLRSGEVLATSTLDNFSKVYLAADGSGHALGWDVPTGDSAAGTLASSDAIGHLGYTGTSIWMDRQKEVGVVLLTNRTANATSPEQIKAFRQDVHDIVWREY